MYVEFEIMRTEEPVVKTVCLLVLLVGLSLLFFRFCFSCFSVK